MIGLLIQDNAYEQDIRELLMSFYPGEAYAHEVKDGVSFYVESRLGEGEVSLRIWERAERAADGEEAAAYLMAAGRRICLTAQRQKML